MLKKKPILLAPIFLGPIDHIAIAPLCSVWFEININYMPHSQAFSVNSNNCSIAATVCLAMIAE